MNQTQRLALYSYEENRNLSEQISEILASNSCAHTKEKELKKLQSAVTTPLAQSHISYYLKKFRSKRMAFWGRIAVAPFILFYFLHMAYRAYYDLHPDKPHYDFGLALTAVQQAGIFMFAPLLFLIYYIARYLVSQKVLSKKQLKYLSSFCMIGVVALTIYVLSHYLQITPSFTEPEEILIELSAEPEYTELPESVFSETEPVLRSTKDNITPLNDINPEDLSGGWSDTVSQRCWMNIEHVTDTHYDIYISWSSSAWENTEWNFSGSLDTSTGILSYSGDKIHTVYSDDGTVSKEFVYTDGSGIFYVDQDHNLYWEDDKENAGARCIFQKDEISN